MATQTSPSDDVGALSNQVVNPDYIAMVCPARDCRVAIVSPRELSRVHGRLTDAPTATSGWLLCLKHSQEGDYMEYFDEHGNQVSGDPDTFTQGTDLPTESPEAKNG